MVQDERNLMVVFPHAYHGGFNHGFNIAEASNFALHRWLDYAKRFRDCLCRDADRDVSFNLEPFVKELQPEKLEDWKGGLDFQLHPEDPSNIRNAS